MLQKILLLYSDTFAVGNNERSGQQTQFGRRIGTRGGCSDRSGRRGGGFGGHDARIPNMLRGMPGLHTITHLKSNLDPVNGSTVLA